MANFVKINKEEYKELLNKVSFKTFFHDLAWHEFLAQQFKWLKFEYYLYKDDSLLPLARFKVFDKEKLVSLPFCEYGGPLPLKGDINWEEFSKDVFSKFGNNIRIKIHPYFGLSGNPPGTSSILSSHWLKNLEDSSEQEIWDSFRKTLRHEIKHAQEQNLRIKRCENLKELKQFYNLYVVNLKRKKTVPYTSEIIKCLYQYGGAELLLAFYKNKIIAGSMFLNYSGFVHYFLNASKYKYRNFGANYLIIWEKLKELIGKDVIFDFGASPRGSNLEIFKRGWGGTEYPIYQIGTKRSPAFVPMDIGTSAGREESLRYSKIRNIWGLLPVFVIKKISRYFIKYRI